MTSNEICGSNSVPSAAFTEAYKEYLRILSVERMERSFEESENRVELKRRLEAEFMQAFHFRSDKGKLAERFFYRLMATPLRPKEQLFDHVRFYRRGANIIIASHGYGFNELALARWCRGVFAHYQIVGAWRHYDSTDANLFFVEFTTEAKNDIDRKVRALRG